jgi:hypothetical protein
MLSIELLEAFIKLEEKGKNRKKHRYPASGRGNKAS